MTIGQELFQEFILETQVTRLFLEKVPFDKAAFRLHRKSERLDHLATHVAEIIAWWTEVIKNDELNFIDFKQKEIKSTKELIEYYDRLLEEAKRSLLSVTDQELDREWSMTYGEKILFTLPKKQVLRIFCMNHLIHHRAQLGTYLRVLNIPIPATYGPSADDEDVILITPFKK